MIRGPGSVIYGTNAMTGVINIITRQQKGSDALEVSAKTGSFNSDEQSLHSAFDAAGLNGNISLNHKHSGGWQAEAIHGNSATEYQKYNDTNTLQGDFSYGDFSFSTLLTNYETNFIQPAFGVYDFPVTAKLRYYDVGYKTDLTSSWNMSAHYSYLHLEDSQFFVTENTQQAEFLLNGQLNDVAKVLIGITGEVGEASTADYNPSVLRPQVVNFKPSEKNYSAFTQLDYKLSNQLQAYAGVQWNRVENRDEDISPRLGVIYETSLQRGVKLLYNEAFRSPTFTELNVDMVYPGVGTIFMGNPNLNSEKVKTADLQWFNYRYDHQATVTAFYSRYSDRIETTLVSFKQVSSVDIAGLELEDKWAITDKDRLQGGYTWQENQDGHGNNDVTQAPSWVLNAGYVRSFGKESSASIYDQHWDQFKDTAGNTNPKTESHDLLSANLRYSLRDLVGSRIGLSSAYLVLYGYNLLNQEMWQPDFVTTPNTIQTYGGRAVYLSLELAW